MKYMDEFRNRSLVMALARQIHREADRPVRIMEVCGTHTMAIFRHGIRDMLPACIELVSGPGCPVCVTPSGTIDAFIDLARRPDITITTFGDMLRVPGTSTDLSLAQARAQGADVRIVYSPMDALTLAAREPDRQVVFLAVGFETTIPTIAATILAAEREDIANFSIFPAVKTMKAPLKTLMEDPEVRVDGLLCPGHVSIIVGSDNFKFLADPCSGHPVPNRNKNGRRQVEEEPGLQTKKHGLACAVAGFEPTDILQGVLALIRQINAGAPTVENCYGRAVTGAGNRKARQIMDKVFTAADSEWRGLGLIPNSGLCLRTQYEKFDITRRLELTIPPSVEPRGCRCGDILRSICAPPDCPLFGRACTPANPIGPCMVSSEGTCAAWHKYHPEETLP